MKDENAAPKSAGTASRQSIYPSDPHMHASTSDIHQEYISSWCSNSQNQISSIICVSAFSKTLIDTMAAKQQDHWDSAAYQNSASFVPKLATKIIQWLDVQEGDDILDVGCGGEFWIWFRWVFCKSFCVWC